MTTLVSCDLSHLTHFSVTCFNTISSLSLSLLYIYLPHFLHIRRLGFRLISVEDSPPKFKETNDVQNEERIKSCNPRCHVASSDYACCPHWQITPTYDSILFYFRFFMISFLFVLIFRLEKVCFFLLKDHVLNRFRIKSLNQL